MRLGHVRVPTAAGNTRPAWGAVELGLWGVRCGTVPELMRNTCALIQHTLHSNSSSHTCPSGKALAKGIGVCPAISPAAKSRCNLASAIHTVDTRYPTGISPGLFGANLGLFLPIHVRALCHPVSFSPNATQDKVERMVIHVLHSTLSCVCMLQRRSSTASTCPLKRSAE